jgi:lysophospholipase L1-like esterase
VCAKPSIAAESERADTNPPLDAPRPAVARGWLWGYLALALPALVLAGDTAWAFAWGWRPTYRIDLLIVAATAVWLFLVTAWLAVAAGRRFFARYRARLILLSASVCLAWLVGEAAVGAVLPRIGDPFHCFRPATTIVHYPNPQIMRGVAPEATARYNDWGVRATNPPPRDEAYRILCVGGSSTACTYLDDSKAWPQLLADALENGDPARHYWVGSASIPGFRTTEHLQFAEESPLVDEVDCLVVQTGINDFMSCLAGPRRASPLWGHSNIRQLARTLVFRAMGDTMVEDTGGTVYTRRRAHRQAAPLDDSEPQLAGCLRQYEQDLDDLIDACRARYVRIVFTTQPTLWQNDLDAENLALLWFGQMPDGRYLSVARLRAGMDRYNEVLRRVCQQRKVELVDLSELDGDPAMFYDDCHFTERGAKRVARLVADALQARSSGPPQEPAR